MRQLGFASLATPVNLSIMARLFPFFAAAQHTPALRPALDAHKPVRNAFLSLSDRQSTTLIKIKTN